MSSLLTQGIRRQALTMMPCRHESALYISDWILSNTIKRFSILAESECETLITDADSFTSDGRLIMNESAEVSYFVASGSNGHGIALDGGVGKYIAEFIHNGNTNLSAWCVDIRRFIRLHTIKRFLQDRL
ncbi:unnamed protein product [Adineta steineri]|uniref:Uncharacterized protein n=1 Tax=Adineta steineri TaxID=433720 RepID=A0A816BXK4_9BILA|nr:unnamed protein product [Adineta steineri]CAF0982366.1 unnamed protein product [Adineta steineri]CAF1410311.1 unnamed protein product [Adineta steineri]CAF1617337.1 unnamed protein product [Adineta steineri]